MKHIAYGNITQRNEEKEVIIDSLKKMNCPVFIESDIDNRREKWTEFIDISHYQLGKSKAPLFSKV